MNGECGTSSDESRALEGGCTSLGNVSFSQGKIMKIACSKELPVARGDETGPFYACKFLARLGVSTNQINTEAGGHQRKDGPGPKESSGRENSTVRLGSLLAMLERGEVSKLFEAGRCHGYIRNVESIDNSLDSSALDVTKCHLT
ncbi:hypothetical protein RRG08_022126 [Elysia crispata]|uniref:Uncharacterized protein n=1 Tax=Elysia crispata TaxID=231223 RepID=A0AAE0Y000_9GAST|nr:hypothetical protein RRG08_022126 [Elysia crispata]